MGVQTLEKRNMTTKEANRLSLMKQIDKGTLTLRKAAEELGISERQVKRLRKRYRIEGDTGLISKHVGKISPNKIDPKTKAEVIKILHREEYKGFGPLLLNEKLNEKHKYHFSNETIRKWMVEEELWITKKQRKKKVYQRRLPRARFGELLQGDGSRHAWFEERGEECTLVLFVDDATSRLTAARFVPAETTLAYQEILEQHLKKYGRPIGIYVDKHAIFRTSRENSAAKENETHFGRVLRELDIELICANSPQAKGRVERANGTLQDRLIKEMRLHKINTIEKANAFLPTFIESYNKKFGRSPRDLEDAHRSLNQKIDLEMIFARRSNRKLTKDYSFQYEGISYQINPKNLNRFRATQVEILERPNKPILVRHEGKELAYIEWGSNFYSKPKVLDAKELEAHCKTKKTCKPGRHHPWR